MEKEIVIPQGNTPEDAKARKQIIGDFYAKWNAEHPDKKVWNESLQAFIHIKFLSINWLGIKQARTSTYSIALPKKNKASLGR